MIRFNTFLRMNSQHMINLRLLIHPIKIVERLLNHLFKSQIHCLIHLQSFLLITPSCEVILILIEHILSNNLLAYGMSRARHQYVVIFPLLLVFQLFTLSML